MWWLCREQWFVMISLHLSEPNLWGNFSFETAAISRGIHDCHRVAWLGRKHRKHFAKSVPDTSNFRSHGLKKPELLGSLESFQVIRLRLTALTGPNFILTSKKVHDSTVIPHVLPIFAQGYCLYGMDFKAFGRQEAQAKVESWKSEANLWIPNSTKPGCLF